MSRSLDLPATEGVDTLAQELAKLQDNGKRRIAFLGSRHVPVVDIHLIELIARSLAEEGHNILTSGSQGVNAAVIRAVLDINPSLLTVLLPQSLDRQIPEIKDQLQRVMHLVEKVKMMNYLCHLQAVFVIKKLLLVRSINMLCLSR